MPPGGCHAISIDEEKFELLTQVVVKYNCDSIAEAIEKSATVAMEQDGPDLAQILVELLNN
jgi:hypothetical protein